jgi:hypothetical protein
MWNGQAARRLPEGSYRLRQLLMMEEQRISEMFGAKSAFTWLVVGDDCVP